MTYKKLTKDNLQTIITKSKAYADSKAASGFSGSYNDLTDKPTILSETEVNALIDTKLGVIENGSY